MVMLKSIKVLRYFDDKQPKQYKYLHCYYFDYNADQINFPVGTGKDVHAPHYSM